MIYDLLPFAIGLFGSFLFVLHIVRREKAEAEASFDKERATTARETAVKPAVATSSPATVPPTVPESEESKPKPDILTTFCTAIRDFEGKPGDLNYRNNNPGNFRCSPVGYLAKYGDVKCKGGFACFPTYELGWLYLENSVRDRARRHPAWTIRDFFYNYAPPADDNPTEKYAATVAARCGVPVDCTLAELFG